MINLLLSASEFFAEASDFIATRWAELLGLVGGTSGLLVIMRTLFVLISSKIKKNNNVPINETIQDSIARVQSLETQITGLQNIIAEFPVIVKTQLTSALTQYQNIKKKIFEDITNGNEEIQELVSEIPTQVLNVGLTAQESVGSVADSVIEEISENVEVAEKDVKEVVKKVVKQRELL